LIDWKLVYYVYMYNKCMTMVRYLDTGNGIGSEPFGRQRIFNQTIMDQLIAAVNECKQPGMFQHYSHSFISAR